MFVLNFRISLRPLGRCGFVRGSLLPPTPTTVCSDPCSRGDDVRVSAGWVSLPPSTPPLPISHRTKGRGGEEIRIFRTGERTKMCNMKGNHGVKKRRGGGAGVIHPKKLVAGGVGGRGRSGRGTRMVQYIHVGKHVSASALGLQSPQLSALLFRIRLGVVGNPGPAHDAFRPTMPCVPFLS